jgi:hypothetical protein
MIDFDNNNIEVMKKKKRGKSEYEWNNNIVTVITVREEKGVKSFYRERKCMQNAYNTYIYR